MTMLQFGNVFVMLCFCVLLGCAAMLTVAFTIRTIIRVLRGQDPT